MQEIYDKYLDYFKNLNQDNINQLNNLATENLHFVDPFNDVRDRQKVIKIFEDMFKKLNNLKFELLEVSEINNKLFLEWNFSFSLSFINFGKQHTIRGVSIISANPEFNLIQEHLDYWDAASNVYEHIPVFKYFMKAAKQMF